MSSAPLGAAILGSGNIGTDLLVKMLDRGKGVRPIAMVGIDAASDGLARARDRGVLAIDTGLAGLMAHPAWSEIALVFDATSAASHHEHHRALEGSGRRLIDLTPAAIGPFVVPVVNLDTHRDATNINMVTCGGQATLPILHAIDRIAPIDHGEIVAAIASRSAGPGTRANIDEFTATTARAIRELTHAEHGKAIIILNPADPPLLMRDTVHAFVPEAAPGIEDVLTASVEAMVREVQGYVPGYRLVQPPAFRRWQDPPLHRPGQTPAQGLQVTVLLEVRGHGDWLPPYAGNLDIMTAAALAVGERLASTAGGAP